MSRLHLITAPPAYPISLSEVKAHLNVDHTDDDVLIAGMLGAAISYLDGRDGILGRALVQQTWELRCEYFPLWGNVIALPLPPLISVDSVKYVDLNGAIQTVAPSVYQVVESGFGQPWIELAYDQSWPSYRNIRDAIRIRYTCGYVDYGQSPTSDIPTDLRHAVYLLTSHFYQNRDAVVVGQMGIAAIGVPLAFAALVEKYKVGALG